MDVLGAVIAVCFVGGRGGMAFAILRRFPLWRVAGFFAVGNGANAVKSWLAHDTLNTAISAACCALGAWQWWSGGGGGKTRRGLRALRSAFRGVRRTAPVPDGAS